MFRNKYTPEFYFENVPEFYFENVGGITDDSRNMFNQVIVKLSKKSRGKAPHLFCCEREFPVEYSTMFNTVQFYIYCISFQKYFLY